VLSGTSAASVPSANVLRKRRNAGKCEGRRSHAERNPELVALAKRLNYQKPRVGPAWRGLGKLARARPITERTSVDLKLN
jgi:hypothetical protein